MPPGAWVLDPFGASPRQVVEAARAGYRLLVASNNPVNRYLIELIANPPSQAELKAALADLGATTKGDQRLEPLILGLYRTQCPACAEEIIADAFIWERAASRPVRKWVRCPKCNTSGEFPLSDYDQEQLHRLPPGSLHRARALERVTPLDDPDRNLVEEALDTYLPRALYALFTIINKLDQLPGHHLRPLSALLLATFDTANSLWSHPPQRNRPRQLSVPATFREYNVWLAMEEALLSWTSAYPTQSQHLPIHYWPDLPSEPGAICLYEGRVRDLLEEITPPGKGTPASFGTEKHPSLPNIQAVLAPLPRPNQAFWTLSTLWSGWLWGREAALPMKVVLHRRRYDWNWHTAALHSGFSSLSHLLQPGTKIFELIAEIEPGFISAALLANALAGFEDSQIAMRESAPFAQITCLQTSKSRSPKSGASVASDQELLNAIFAQARPAALNFLAQRGQPSPYIFIHSAALQAVAAAITSATIPAMDQEPQELTALIQAGLGTCFSQQAGFLRYHGSPNAIETGLWWLYETHMPLSSTRPDVHPPSQGLTSGEQIQPPLDERVEMEIVRILLRQAPLPLVDLDRQLCQLFRGCFTPDLEWIQACLESYAEQNPPESGLWQLRAQESPTSRRQDLDQAANLLTHLGERLGYGVTYTPTPVRQLVWQDPPDKPIEVFYLVASAVISHLLIKPAYPQVRNWIVYPGGRAGLLVLKLRRDPRLQALVDQGWRFLKFRHLRRLADNEQINRRNMLELFDQDPLTKQDSQIAFF